MDNTFKYILILVFISLNTISVHAQYATGLADEDPNYSTTSLVLLPSSKADLPRNIDLRAYCPYPGNQGKIASCVGWAVGYGLMTIEKAIENNNMDRKDITNNAFSALFVYNQVKSDEGNCKSASVMSSALELIQTKGNCYAQEFDFKLEDCYVKPDANLKMRAKTNAIVEFNRLFPTDADGKTKTDAIRKVLAQKKPVAIGLKINDYFMALQGTDYWNPRLGKEPDLTHAMVIVGYDDDADCFILLNSWGRVWGQDGFIRVKYRDMGEYCRFAFAVYFSKNADYSEPIVVTQTKIEQPRVRNSIVVANTQGQKQPVVNPNSQNPPVANPITQNKDISNQAQQNKPVVNSPAKNGSMGNQTPTTDKMQPKSREMAATTTKKRELVTMSGNLEVNYFSGRFTDMNEPIFETAGVEQVGNHYTLTKKDWHVGDVFQLALTSNINGAYVYIVSINPRNEVKIMFPRHQEFGPQYNGSFESPLMMLDGARAVLPRPDKVMKVDYAGTDRICILFSTRKIKGFPIFCDHVQKWKGNFDDYLHNLLGDIMIPMSDTEFSLNKVGFSVSTRSEGSIVPIVIEFKSQ